MKIGSLFSGYGGLDMAVSTFFNAEVAWHAEVEPAAIKILEHHYPHIPNVGDVTKVDWGQVEPVDIITGGSPCQDLSSAGKRAGMQEGTRSNLWHAMREAIEVIKPKYVVWENVRGALSAKATSESDRKSNENHEECPDSDMEPTNGQMGNLRALGRVLGDLAEIGYDTQWQVVRASDVGAPHRRERVFVLGKKADATNP